MPHGFYPPLSVGVSPNSVHRPTDMSRELSTVTTAARARPHLDFTMSILPRHTKFFSGGQNYSTAISSTSLNGNIFRGYQDFSSKVKNCVCIDCNGLCVCV
uniref:Uncharacterized protein n=1 Tax=Neolamprologus brichardi TaxID=32507 RepID=A0A3Q4HDV7_NEOBR